MTLFAETTAHDLISAALMIAVGLVVLAGFLLQLKLRRLIFEEQVKRKKAEEEEEDRAAERKRKIDRYAAQVTREATDSIKAATSVATAEVRAVAPGLTKQVCDNSVHLEEVRAELAEHKKGCPNGHV